MKHPAITENHLYGKAYAKGKVSKGRYTVVYVLRDLAYGKLLRRDPHRKPFNRVGLTVTKTIGHATVRSRVRRILRAGLSEAEKRKMTEGKLIVICARSAAAGAKSTDIARELTMHFERLGLYLNPQKKAEQAPGTVPATGAGNAKPTGSVKAEPKSAESAKAEAKPAGSAKAEPKLTATGGKPDAAVTKPAGNAKPAETVPATAAAEEAKATGTVKKANVTGVAKPTGEAGNTSMTGTAKPTGEAGIPGETDAKKKLPETGATLS